MSGLPAFAQSSGFSGEDRLVTAAAAPYNNKYTQIKWGGEESRSDCGIPLTCSERLLLPCGSSLLFLGEETGEVKAEVALPDECSEKYAGARLEASLLLPTEHGISLINTEKAAVTSSRCFDGATASDCAIIDEMGYVAVESGDGFEFLCIDLGSEGLTTLWSCEVPEQPTAATVQGDNIIFGAGSCLYTSHYKDGGLIEIPLGKEITGAPFATEYAVFFSTKDGNVGKLRLNPDGTLENDTLFYCKVGGSPSSPLSWNGRLYVAAEDGFYILDNLNMDVTHIITEIKGGCTPQVHYGSGPYIYTVAEREDRWAVYCVLDMEEESDPSVSILAQMENYTNGAFCASSKGTLFFLDGIGRVYALTIAPFDVFGLIIRLVVVLALIVVVFIWLKKVAQRRADLKPKY
ncbi:MAG: hypothetical protein ACI4WS_13725 [Oscillospiraceae bacterium]